MSRNVSKKRKATTSPVDELSNEDDSKKVKNGGSTGDQKFFETKIAEIEEEIRLIKEWKHAELVEKIEVFESKKEKELKEAKVLRDLRQKELDAMYEFQTQESNDVCAYKKKSLQERMLGEAEENLKRLKDREGAVAKKKTTTATGTGRTRSSSIAEEEESQEDEENASIAPNQQGEEGGSVEGDGAISSQQTTTTTTTAAAQNKKSTRSIAGGERDKKMNGMDLTITYSAPADLISEDLATIHAEWMKRVSGFTSQEDLANMTIRVEEGRLFFNEQIIEKGANVIVYSETSKEELFGVVTKISAGEILVKLADGGNSRLLLSHLRAGRCKVVKDIPKESSGAVTAAT